MIDQPLSDMRQQSLRAQGVISTSEIAIKVGDLYVAHNIVSGDRREITVVEPVTETKQVLRG